MKLDATFRVTYSHRLRCTEGLFRPDNPLLIDLLGPPAHGPARVAVFVDDGVVRANPGYVADIESYAAQHATHLTLVSGPHPVPGGEAAKGDRKALDRVLEQISESHICRHSYVLVIGGGAVLDCVGLAASLAHRGVRLIRVATTTLSQADSALGVKNGINAFAQKNYLGVYDVPWAVVHDEATLATLAEVDWIAGFSEAVKVALLKDAALFGRIEATAPAIHARDYGAAIPVIRESARHHFEHITQNGDPFERGDARPLDFGHWAAHKLEQLSHYEVRHGTAVAIGLAIDVTYARLQGWLAADVHERILRTLDALGFPLQHPLLAEHGAIMQGLADFQEHLGGVRSIPMIRDIGEAFEVHDIDEDIMGQALEWLVRWEPAAISERSMA